MLQRKNNTSSIIFLALIALAGFSRASNIEGNSGEIIAIPSFSQINNNKFLIKKESQVYQLVSLPFVKNDLLITRHDKDVLVKYVNFGESRITITDTSKVNLSSEDQERANSEAMQIKKSLSESTKSITPSFQFISPVQGRITSPFGKQRFINGQPRSAHLALDLAGSEGTPIVADRKSVV